MTPDTYTLRRQLRKARSVNALLALVLSIILLFLVMKGL